MTEPLHECIGYVLVQVMKAHRYRAENALNQLGLHTGQEMILFQLWEQEGLAQSQLVENLCVEPPTVTKMLQRLEKAGLVERRQDSEDGRISRVYLTTAGRALEAPVRQIWATLERDLAAGLSETEKMLLRRLLMQLQGNLQR
ncbi:MAG: MarR family transcriptional regulator [Chloroflexi bacterium]|nr:MarR family transcriptional regulator [Chloroflexota bacterium]